MRDWVPFMEGEYIVERAFLVGQNGDAALLEDAVIEVFKDNSGLRRLRGRGRIRNVLMVELLDDNDVLNLALDLGEEFRYLLASPDIQAGKVFSEDVKSVLKFVPDSPWRHMTDGEFETFLSRLKIISR